MIVFFKTYIIIPVREFWYDYDNPINTLFSFRVYFRVLEKYRPSFWLVKFTNRTIVINLEEPEAVIFSNFSKQTRNCIRQAERLSCITTFGVALQEFIPFYNQFARKKHLRKHRVSDFENLGNNYTICQVSYEGQVVAMHLYIKHPDSGEVQLFKSASVRLFSRKFNSNLVGKANKLLHYKAICHFRELSFRRYDFGGYSIRADADYEKFHGVSQFKKGFGGTELVYLNYASLPYYVLRFFAQKLRT